MRSAAARNSDLTNHFTTLEPQNMSIDEFLCTFKTSIDSFSGSKVVKRSFGKQMTDRACSKQALWFILIILEFRGEKKKEKKRSFPPFSSNDGSTKNSR